MALRFLDLAGGLILCAVLVTYISRAFRGRLLEKLRGPPCPSWLIGNLRELMQPFNVGDAEFAWIRDFGGAFKIKGAFGRDILYTADPKALHYIMDTGGYSYPKGPETRAVILHLTGRGLSWSEGSQHAKQRRIMNPAFSYDSLRQFLPIFQQSAQKMIVKWKDLLAESSKTAVVLDIPTWLSRVTLDVIGATAFDYDFGALDQEENELAAVYHNLLAESFGERSDGMIAIGALPSLLPIIQLIPSKTMTRLHSYMSVARRVAKAVVDRQLAAHAAGQEGGKDAMSLLVKANLAEDPKSALSEEEILSQMTTLMLAGHETTASTTSWALYELSRRSEIQAKLREEIKAARAESARRGRGEFTISDLESMPILGAVIKETLRCHPTLPGFQRLPVRDDVIPLSTPIVGKTGELIHEIPVRKGQRVFVSLAAYNRLESVWGEDASMWRPERFLEGIEKRQKTTLGIFANLATFASGVRSCIGWRFAIIELQSVLVEIIENFEFSPPPGNVEIRRAPAALMTPMVKGSKTGRTELPLTVRSVE